MEKNNKDFVTYYYKHPISIYVFYGIFCAVLLAPAIYNLLKVLQVANLISYYKTLEIISVIVCLVAIGVVSYFMFCNRYVITKDEFVYCRFTKKTYSKEKLITIKKDQTSGLTVLYVEDETKEDGVGFIVLSVFKKNELAIIDSITKLNPHVSVETIRNRDEKR